MGVGVFSPAAAPQEALSVVAELTLCSAVELDGMSSTKLTRQSEPKNLSLTRVGHTAYLQESHSASLDLKRISPPAHAIHKVCQFGLMTFPAT